jgi:hypothetical protein
MKKADRSQPSSSSSSPGTSAPRRGGGYPPSSGSEGGKSRAQVRRLVGRADGVEALGHFVCDQGQDVHCSEVGTQLLD